MTHNLLHNLLPYSIGMLEMWKLSNGFGISIKLMSVSILTSFNWPGMEQALADELINLIRSSF